MPRLPGRDAREIRELQPAARAAWDEIEANVLRSGIVEQRLKELCYAYLAEEVRDAERYAGRERAALDWTDAIAYDSGKADDELWRRLHDAFTEPVIRKPILKPCRAAGLQSVWRLRILTGRNIVFSLRTNAAMR